MGDEQCRAEVNRVHPSKAVSHGEQACEKCDVPIDTESRHRPPFDVESSQRMWTGTVGVKGGFDVGSDQWHWDVSYSHARYKTTETSINLKEEGIRDWIMNGASTVITDANQQYTYFVDADFYDNELVDNIVRPMLVSGRAEVGTLTVFIGVLGGLATFGAIGLFLGPVVLALIIALIRFVLEIRRAEAIARAEATPPPAHAEVPPPQSAPSGAPAQP